MSTASANPAKANHYLASLAGWYVRLRTYGIGSGCGGANVKAALWLGHTGPQRCPLRRGGDESGKCLRVERTAVEIALEFGAASVGDEGVLLDGLDPFCQDRQAQSAAQRQNGVGDGRPLLTPDGVAHEAFVDLQLAQWK